MKPGAIAARHALNQTGCVGISIVRSAANRRDGTVQLFFSVHARLTSGPNGRKRNRKFCISTLGREEAWRRALRYRAQHELRIRPQITQAIFTDSICGDQGRRKSVEKNSSPEGAR